MKLLFAIKNLHAAVGGAERVLCTICSELVGRGHDVTIVTFDPPNSQPFYALDKRVKRIDLAIGNTARKAGMAELLRRMCALRRVAMQQCPQVAIGFMHSMFVPLAFAMAGTGVPVVGSEHIVPEHYRTRRIEYGLLIAAAPFMSKVTVLFESIRARYPALLRKRMVVIPNPVMTVIDKTNLEIHKPRYVLLNVGRLDDQKDQATLLRAFARIADRHSTWNLRIVGEGPLRHKLEDLVHGLGLGDRVQLPGVIADIGAEYRAADMFVISSRYEAFGLVTAEAMLHGLPVLGFADCPGTNELIEHRRTGLLASSKPDRVQSLALELDGLLSNPNLRRSLGQAAGEVFNQQFSAQSICSLWESLLSPLCLAHDSKRAALQNGSL